MAYRKNKSIYRKNITKTLCPSKCPINPPEICFLGDFLFYLLMEFYKKYRHIGNSYAGVPKYWVPVVEKHLKRIEKVMWPQWWMPLFVKRFIHFLATDNSVVRIRYRWAYKLRNKLTGHQIIQDIKEKYGTLRIYGYHGKEIDDIITEAENECDNTCQDCGSNNEVKCVNNGWVYALCQECRNGPAFSPKRQVLIEKY
jgi:hypothetical protein